MVVTRLLGRLGGTFFIPNTLFNVSVVLLLSMPFGLLSPTFTPGRPPRIASYGTVPMRFGSPRKEAELSALSIGKLFFFCRAASLSVPVEVLALFANAVVFGLVVDGLGLRPARRAVV